MGWYEIDNVCLQSCETFHSSEKPSKGVGDFIPVAWDESYKWRILYWTWIAFAAFGLRFSGVWAMDCVECLMMLRHWSRFLGGGQQAGKDDAVKSPGVKCSFFSKNRTLGCLNNFSSCIFEQCVSLTWSSESTFSLYHDLVKTSFADSRLGES